MGDKENYITNRLIASDNDSSNNSIENHNNNKK